MDNRTRAALAAAAADFFIYGTEYEVEDVENVTLGWVSDDDSSDLARVDATVRVARDITTCDEVRRAGALLDDSRNTGNVLYQQAGLNNILNHSFIVSAVATSASKFADAAFGSTTSTIWNPKNGWEVLLGNTSTRTPVVLAPVADACNVSSLHDANQTQLMLAYLNYDNCSHETQVENLRNAGAAGILFIEDPAEDHIVFNQLEIPLPTIMLNKADGDVIWQWVSNGGNVSMRPNPVELRASVGNLRRNILVKGEVQRGCSKNEHAENLDRYKTFCKHLSFKHHECVDMLKALEHMPDYNDCYWWKGYGASMLTSEWNYGSIDEYRTAMANNNPPPTHVGETKVHGVEFRDFGKMTSFQKGWHINYFNAQEVNNEVDRCVFRNNWHDGIVLENAPGASITNTIIHKTLGNGVLRWTNQWGDIITNNLVSDGFDYPASGATVGRQRKSMTTRADRPEWQSGIYLMGDVMALRDNVVAGCQFAGLSFKLQDSQDQPDGHKIAGNEAYASKYGAIVTSMKK